jgi:putative ABC transport system permease protein
MMEQTYAISPMMLAVYLLLLIIPITIFRLLHLKLTRSLLIAVGRMVVQLSLVAVYLGVIFHLDSLLLNCAWLAVMLIVANLSILHQSGIKKGKLLTVTLPTYALVAAGMLLSFTIVFPASTIVHARYLIPMGGMLLGNLLKGNIVGFDRFYSSLQRREHEYMHYVTLGASRWEALRPFFAEAFKAAMAPQIAGIATIGLVALPGMMTGQILGGSTPTVAIRYQIMIMVAIYITMALSLFSALLLSTRVTIDCYGCLRREYFSSGKA